MASKIKAFWRQYESQIFLCMVIVLVAALSFGIGRLSVIYGEKPEYKILYPENDSLIEKGGKFVASKSGTAYHFPWCSGAQTMKPENRIYFESKAEAEAAGYHPAGNCKGL